jgi:hypothetical protein
MPVRAKKRFAGASSQLQRESEKTSVTLAVTYETAIGQRGNRKCQINMVGAQGLEPWTR